MAGKRSSGSYRRFAAAACWWATAWLVTLATYPFTNDHFGRISAARQIARYGELPFRDFLDPGYVLTELASAGVQLLFGDNLLGEMLWTSSLIATGAVLLFALTRRVAPSRLSAIVIGVLILLAQPRQYDADKFLFYPLGIFLCWHYADRPGITRLWMLAGCAVIAGMFRYDNGLFILASGLVTVAAVHFRDARILSQRAALLIAASATCAVPYLLFLQLNGGIANAAEQMLTYARREGGRTRLTGLPSPVPSELRVIYHPDHVQVRWASSADAEQSGLEQRYTLHNGVGKGGADARTWLYEIDDISRDNLRRLISDPHVIDTHLIDRSTVTLVREESRWIRLYRQIPVIGKWSVTWTSEDAANSLYWLFLLMPVFAVATVCRGSASDRPYVLGAATIAVCVAGLILREPLAARMSGAAGPTIVLGASLWRHVHRRWPARIVATAAVITVAVVTAWSTTLRWLVEDIPILPNTLAQAAMSPPSPMLLPAHSVSSAIDYVRRCTRPDDRVFAGWFVPELYFFSQRAFAGGMVVAFGHHWSESAAQQRIIEKLASESVPLVILPNDNGDFQETYVELTAYFRSHYRSVGATTFGPSESPSYIVLTLNDRVPTSTDPISSLPCFGDRD
jgi:hypothetical protein